MHYWNLSPYLSFGPSAHSHDTKKRWWNTRSLDKYIDSISNNIQDPWKVFTCNDKGEGCSANFFDDEYVLNNKSSLYYARAIQEPTNIVGGDPLRCELNESGDCIKIRPCYSSGPDFDPNDDCLAPVGERAWSSPIFLTHPMSLY